MKSLLSAHGSLAAASPPGGFSAPATEEQLSLFPELCENELPKRVMALRHSNNFRAQFVYHFFMTKNATKSVLLAGSRCSEESARRIGSRLLSCVDIRAALNFFAEKVEANSLYSVQEVLLDIMENRERAKNPGDGKRPDYRAINEANRMLGQFKKMFGTESAVTANIVSFRSFDEFDKYMDGIGGKETSAE